MDSHKPNLTEQDVTNLVSAFYQLVREDKLIGPLYPEKDWEGAEQRLRDFLIYRFGGSDRYIQVRGHPRLRMRHAPFKIGVEERDRWLKLMNLAMEESDVSGSVQSELKAFFEQVADFLRN